MATPEKLLRNLEEDFENASKLIGQQYIKINTLEVANIRAREALYMCAASCQGGHSDAGAAAAEVLGIPFPVSMLNLWGAALREGLDPDKLWPWYTGKLARKEAKRAEPHP